MASRGARTSGSRRIGVRPISGVPLAGSGVRGGRGCWQAARAGARLAPIREALEQFERLPPSEKRRVENVAVVADAFKASKAEGLLQRWGEESTAALTRRTVGMNELRSIGIKDPGAIYRGGVSNEDNLNFLVAVVGAASVVAVAGTFLPGDWGFWVPYLGGGSAFAVLAIGSTAPGILGAAITAFGARTASDYKERTLRHEAGHLLVAYLLGAPISGYSLDLGKEHIDISSALIGRSLYERSLSNADLDVLGVIAMSGVAAEGMHFEEVKGQTADLFDLQRMINRTTPKMREQDQQNFTRWCVGDGRALRSPRTDLLTVPSFLPFCSRRAVFAAASLLKNNQRAYEALMEAMSEGRPVDDCVAAIEEA